MLIFVSRLSSNIGWCHLQILVIIIIKYSNSPDIHHARPQWYSECCADGAARSKIIKCFPFLWEVWVGRKKRRESIYRTDSWQAPTINESVRSIYLVLNLKCCGEAESDPDLDNLSPVRLSREIECNLGQVSVLRSDAKSWCYFWGELWLWWWDLQWDCSL